MTSEIFTLDRLVHFVKTSLDPKEARLFRGEERVRRCASPIIERIRLGDGTVAELFRQKRTRKIGAGYVRVSTPRQADYEDLGDGFSIDFQVLKVAMHFISKGEAFQIFTDAGISGGAPIDNTEIMREMWGNRADLYQEIFEHVLLSESSVASTPSQRAGMIRYMEEHCAEMRSGGLSGPRSEGEEISDDEAEVFRSDRPTEYRPGLTVLVDNLPRVHTVAVVDMSRLARSQFLFFVLTARFDQHGVQVVGITESLDWMTKRKGGIEKDAVGNSINRGIGQSLMKGILPTIAEYRIREAMLGSMRGIVTMLVQGCPHGSIPFWVKRLRPPKGQRQEKVPLSIDGHLHPDDDLFGENRAVSDVGEDRSAELDVPLATKYVRNIPEMLDIVLKMVDYYLDESDNINGFRTVAARLESEGLPDKEMRLPSNAKYVGWSGADVADTLGNRALLGIQAVFGRDWKVYPPLLVRRDQQGQPILDGKGEVQPDLALFERIQVVRKARWLSAAGRKPKDPEGHLLQKFIFCHCGKPLGHFVQRGVEYYKCRSTKRDRDRNPGFRHVMLLKADLEKFFDELIKTHPQAILNVISLGDETDTHLQEIRELRDELLAVEQEIADEREPKQRAAEQELQTKYKLSPEDPDFLDELERMTRLLMRQYYLKQKTLSDQLAVATSIVSRYVRDDAEDTLEQRLARWSLMPTSEKRRLLNRIFKDVRLQGDPPEEWIRLECHGADGVMLPPVRLVTTVIQKQKRTDYQLRLPTVADWWRSGRAQRFVGPE